MAEGNIYCPACRAELVAGARFCGECGSAIPDGLAGRTTGSSRTIFGLDAEQIKAAVQASERAAAEAAEKAQAEQAQAAESAAAEDRAASETATSSGGFTGVQAPAAAPVMTAETQAESAPVAAVTADVPVDAAEPSWDESLPETDEPNARSTTQDSEDADAELDESVEAVAVEEEDAPAIQAAGSARYGERSAHAAEDGADLGVKTRQARDFAVSGRTDAGKGTAVTAGAGVLEQSATVPVAAAGTSAAGAETADVDPEDTLDSIATGPDTYAADILAAVAPVPQVRGTSPYSGHTQGAEARISSGRQQPLVGKSTTFGLGSASPLPPSAASAPTPQQGASAPALQQPAGIGTPAAAKATSLGLGLSTPVVPATVPHPSAKSTALGLGIGSLGNIGQPTGPVAGYGKHTALGLGLSPAAGSPGATGQGAPLGSTMLGVPMASSQAEQRERVSGYGRVNTGGMPFHAPSGGYPSQPMAGYSPAPAFEFDQAGTATGTAPRLPRAALGWVLLGLALPVALILLYLWLGSAGEADVHAHIIKDAQGEALEFEVPGAAVGTRVRFGSQEQTLANGRARFPLASDSLRVGENIVLADVVDPKGSASSQRIVLEVAHRLWVDTSNLRSLHPSIDLKVSAQPGTHVNVDGVDLPLDKQGHATKSYPLETLGQPKSGMIEQTVHYRVVSPKGETTVDELRTRIPVSTIQIDRPGPDLVTDDAIVEIAGAVGKDTEVSIDGKFVRVQDGRFLHKYVLSSPGVFKPRVTASAPGKAPTTVTLNIQRVRDLDQAAREFKYDKSLIFAKIASNPTAYRGQAVALEGRVYALDSRGGTSVLQMLVRPCPASQRCSVWVVDPQAHDVAVDSWVRVLGVIDGEQQFRSESDQVVTVPKVIARFVLPAKL